MKKQLSFLLLIIMLTSILFSCSKSDTATPAKSKTDLLTAKAWIYDEYFRDYNVSNTMLYYKRGKQANLINLDINKVLFKADGTYSEIDENGNTFTGTWKFLNSESQVEVINSMGTFTSTIVTLDDQNYVWFDASTSNGTLGKMIP